LFKSNPQITTKTIAATLGINERNVKKNVKALKEADIIERVGSDKSGRWLVKR
jgi:predicted HTH transcriptional regulator